MTAPDSTTSDSPPAGPLREPTAASPAPSRSRRVVTALKWVVTLGAFAFLLSRQPLPDLLEAMGSVAPGAVLFAIGVLCAAVALGAVRWRMLMDAYGAQHRPSLRAVLYYNWVGFFYNTYLPGGIGGDLLRGIAVKDAFGELGTTRSLAVVFIERIMGLAGMLTVISSAYARFPWPQLQLPAHVASLGPLAALGAVMSVALGRRLGMGLPGRLGRLFRSLPALARPLTLLAAYALSVVNHVLIAITGHVLIASMSEVPSFGESLLVVPLSSAAAFVPISVAGMGVRDTAFVALYELLGVDGAVALAAALALLVCHLASAGLGGLWQLLTPLPPEVRRVTGSRDAQS